MSLTISSNLTASIANRSLTESNAAMERSLSKLASGSRVQSARDDAASMAIGSRIRGELAALKAYQQNATQAVSILQTADGAYARGQDMLIRMRALAAQSQSANLSNTERGMLDTEYQQLKSELTRLSKSTTFNGQSLMAIDNIMMGTESSSTALLGNKILSLDVNNDGYLDLLSVSGGVVYAQYNNRDGTFGAGQTLIGAPGIAATSILSGDFNGDGKMDIVLSRNNSYAIMTANGDGTFSVGSTVAVTHLDSIAVGDMDGDGKDDLVIGSTNVPDFNIRIYTSTGGGFNLTGNYDTGNFTYNIAIGDLNNDGKLDISAVQGSWVTSLIQNSSGSFTQGNVLFGVSALWNSAVKTPQLFDVDRDGDLDMAYFDSNQRMIYATNDGKGNYTSAWNLYTDPTHDIDDAIMADFNGDGYMDVIEIDSTDGLIIVAQNDGNNNFTTTQILNDSSAAQYIFAGDYNNDGRMDVLLRKSGTTAVSLNASNTGQQGTFRVGSSAGTNNNISYRIASMQAGALDQDLVLSAINSIGGAKRAEASIKRSLDMLMLFRTNVGATINRLDKASDNLSTIYENQDNARSAYMDLDVAAEMTVFTAKQIAIQAGISMLAQARTTQQGLLRLLSSEGGIF